MGRLSNLAPRLSSLRSTLSRPRDESGHDIDAEPYRRWYSLKAWKLLRRRVFVRDGYRCQEVSCRRVRPSSDLVADHRKPHRGDPVRFWDEANVQTLCTTCHNSLKQRAERRAPWEG